jgi:hypothetical protein
MKIGSKGGKKHNGKKSAATLLFKNPSYYKELVRKRKINPVKQNTP